MRSAALNTINIVNGFPLNNRTIWKMALACSSVIAHLISYTEKVFTISKQLRTNLACLAVASGSDMSFFQAGY
jgi:hypothetical protein